MFVENGVDESIELIDVNVTVSESLDLFVHLLLHLGENFSHADGGIDLLVPLHDFLSLLLSKTLGCEVLKESSGSLHVVVLPGVR